MESTWQEVWSLGRGRSRTHCALVRTEDGFAVDLFHGDTCLETNYFESEEAAREAAFVLRFQYGSGDGARRLATAVACETPRDLSVLLNGRGEVPASFTRR